MPIESTIIELGDREFIVKEVGFLRSKPWRKKLVEEVRPLFDSFSNVSGLEFSTPEDLLGLWPLVENLLIDGIDIVAEMLITYCQELEDNRAYIEEHATNKQIFKGFQEVILLSDPLGLFRLLGRRTQKVDGLPETST